VIRAGSGSLIKCKDPRTGSVSIYHGSGRLV
jgi:hypothetical protein